MIEAALFGTLVAAIVALAGIIGWMCGEMTAGERWWRRILRYRQEAERLRAERLEYEAPEYAHGGGI